MKKFLQIATITALAVMLFGAGNVTSLLMLQNAAPVQVEPQGMDDAWAVDYFGTELAALDRSGNLTLSGDVGSVDLALSGDLTIGDGTPDLTQDGEDAYVEGTFEVDGSARFDGAIDANSSVTIDGGVTNIGGGSPDVATGDNDLYVTEVLEVDGEAQFDGVVDANSTSDFAGAAVFSAGTGDAISVSAGGALNNDGTLDQNGTSDFGAEVTCSYAGNCLTSGATADLEWLGFAAIGDGTPDGVTDGTAEDLYVEGSAEVDGTIYADGAIDLDGSADEVQLGIAGHATQTNYLMLLEQYDGTDRFGINETGKVAMDATADSDGDNYDNMFYLHYAMTGTGTKDRNYGLVIEGSRAAGQELTSGDHDEAGLKIRVDTHAVTTTAGTVLRGMEAEAKADNPDGTVSSLYGGSFTAKSDTSAGDVGTMIGLTTNVQNNEAVDDALISADFRLMRQAATEPTEEYVVRVRSSSTTGSGADAGIYVTSDYSDTVATDDMDYGIDFDTADVTTAEIRMSNGETINNVVDTVVQVGSFFAFSEGVVIDLADGGTITATASYQPITNSTGGSITTDTSIAIADGVVAGQILVLVNEDAQDIVIKDGANTLLGADITLTGGAMDSITLLWDGTNWVCLSLHDN